MKKTLKIIGVLAVIVVVLLTLSSVVLRLLLPPAKAKSLVLKQLTGHLKREVALGDVSVGVLSGLQVRYAANRADDRETIDVIRRTFERTGRIVDPHTAVGLAAAQKIGGREPPG